MKSRYQYLFKYLNSNKKNIFVALGFSAILFQFNNCGRLSSQQMNSENSSFATANSAQDLANTPVSSANPNFLKCITSSDAQKISTSLVSAVSSSKYVKSKVTQIDWNQDVDLTVLLDNNCLGRNSYNDSILRYIPPTDLHPERQLTSYTIKKEDVPDLKAFIQAAQDSECLLSAEKNLTARISSDVSDPYFSALKQLTSIGATETTINTVLNFNSGSLYKVKVAVIDTGVDYTNPDLSGQMARDGNGNIIGYNSTGSSTAFNDSGFHGTHVAGLIGAGYHNGIAGSGVYGRNIAIYPVRGTNDGENFKLADLANAIIWAADQGVDVINLSLGTPSESLSVKNALSYALSKNVVVVVAAGNDGTQLSTANPVYPALYSTQFQGLIAVGSIDISSNKLSSFSNYSSTYVDILAPGSNGSAGIYSTVPLTNFAATGAGFSSQVKYDDGTTGPIQGTSMAAPLVSGVLAASISLAKSKSYPLTNSELKSILKNEGSFKISAYASYATQGLYLSFAQMTTAMINKLNQYTAPSPSPSPSPSPTPSSSAPVIFIQPISKQAVVGESVSLSVSASSTSSMSYQWYHNGALINGATSTNLVLSDLAESSTGQYYAIISSNGSQVQSDAATVKVALKYCQ